MDTTFRLCVPITDSMLGVRMSPWCLSCIAFLECRSYDPGIVGEARMTRLYILPSSALIGYVQ